MIEDLIFTEKINAAVAEIAAVAGRLPGVVVVHDLKGKVVWMSDRGLNALNISLEEITDLAPEQYYGVYFNPEDARDYVPRILGLLERNNDDEYIAYFQQVRLSGLDDWKWHMSSTKILLREEAGKPLLTITMSFPIDAMHHMTAKASRLLEENNFLRRNLHIFAKLTKREREVLSWMALGKTTGETAEKLFIAEHTVKTHRKNIKQKLNTGSYYEICQYARAFDLI